MGAGFGGGLMSVVLATTVLATVVHAGDGPPATTPATTPAVAKNPGVLPAAWAAVLQGGCDLKKSGVGSPIDARVLRNIPFAMKGRAFTSPELTALFAQDGGWYQADPKANPTFQGAEQACITKLQKHETALRKKFAIDAAFEARFTQTLEAVTTLRELSAGFQSNTWKMQSHTDGDTQHYSFSETSCSTSDEDQGGGCGGIMLMCEKTGCSAMGAG